VKAHKREAGCLLGGTKITAVIVAKT
jgi:hypothetical protein